MKINLSWPKADQLFQERWGNKQGQDYQEAQESYGRGECFNYFDCGDGFLGEYICHKLLNCTL